MPFELIGPPQQKKKKDQFLVHWDGALLQHPPSPSLRLILGPRRS